MREPTEYQVWLIAFADALTEYFKMSVSEAQAYIRQTGEECWRDSFDDGLTPKEAAAKEAWETMLSAP